MHSLSRKVVLLEKRKAITDHIRKSGFEPVKGKRLKQRLDEAKAD